MEPIDLFIDDCFVEYLDVIYSNKISITPFLHAVSKAETCTDFYKHYISKASSNSFFNRMFRVGLKRGVLDPHTQTCSRHYKVNKTIFNRLIQAEYSRYISLKSSHQLHELLQQSSIASKKLNHITNKRNKFTDMICEFI